jgi:hypothetical protein
MMPYYDTAIMMYVHNNLMNTPPSRAPVNTALKPLLPAATAPTVTRLVPGGGVSGG